MKGSTATTFKEERLPERSISSVQFNIINSTNESHKTVIIKNIVQ